MIKPDNWKPADGFILEPNALKATKELFKSQALTAGPGAGKTEMLAQRADFLLRTGSCRFPKRILAISFKVDASRNLKERVKRRCGTTLSARFDSHTFHAFAKRIIDKFRPILQGNDALDPNYTIGSPRVTRKQIEFADLIPLAIQILTQSQMALNAIRKTYSDAFLDEFQDCTNLQYQLIKLIFERTSIRLTAVGDTKQKIMGWAGALEGIFLKFAYDFEANGLNLYRNFRSKPKLLLLQNEIIKVMDPDSVMPDDLIKGTDGEIHVKEYANSEDEATGLADLISLWVTEDDLPLSEIAVLISKQPDAYAELLMDELQKREIPFRNEQQLQDFTVEPFTRLVVDYLLVLTGDREPNAYSRLMEILTVSATDEESQSKLHTNWSNFIKSERLEIKKIDLFNIDFKDVWAFVVKFLNKFGLVNVVSLSAEYESKTRLKSIVAETKKQFGIFMLEHSGITKALSLFTDDNAVRILTIHKSKGLEFDSVIILGVEEETFWGKPDEERCAFFVAASRARSQLIMSHCGFRQRPTSNPPYWKERRTHHVEFLNYISSL